MEEKSANQSVQRAFALIEALSAKKEMALSDLSRQVNLSKATVYRLLSTLKDLGYVYQDSKTEKYRLGLRFLEISGKLLNQSDIPKEWHPILEKISRQSGETVHLVERNGSSVVYIDKCESTINSVRMVSRIGTVSDCFTTAMGKAMLAHLTDREIQVLWEDGSHPAKTENTITKWNVFLEEINRIRRQGYAVDDEENEIGVRCVAVAIKDPLLQYRYAVSISAPTSRTDDKTLQARADLLKNTIQL